MNPIKIQKEVLSGLLCNYPVIFQTKNINPCDICLKASTELPKLHDPEAKKQLKHDLKVHLDKQW